jgi:hypothetical protein
MKKLKIALSIILIASCGQNIEYYPNKTVINFHGGGYVPKVWNEINEYIRPIQIRGNCYSSCTYALRHSDTCVHKKSRFLFHIVRNKNKTINKEWTEISANSYPLKIKEWFNKHAARTKKDYFFTGKQMIKKFGVKECE